MSFECKLTHCLEVGHLTARHAVDARPPPLMGVALIGVALMGVALMGVALMGVALMGMAYQGMDLLSLVLQRQLPECKLTNCLKVGLIAAPHPPSPPPSPTLAGQLTLSQPQRTYFAPEITTQPSRPSSDI